MAGPKKIYHKSKDRIDTLNKALGPLIQKTQRGFTQTSANINSMRNATRSRGGLTPRVSNCTPEDILELTSRVSRLEQGMVRTKVAEGDRVDFHDLGFQSKNEANA